MENSLKRRKINNEHLSHERAAHSIQGHAVCEETHLKDRFNLKDKTFTRIFKIIVVHRCTNNVSRHVHVARRCRRCKGAVYMRWAGPLSRLARLMPFILIKLVLCLYEKASWPASPDFNCSSRIAARGSACFLI